ncbi:MAG: HAD-IA family hydrolase, partial [bacterium]|nr:HAD-IA family hydrolase [bacterium]
GHPVDDNSRDAVEIYNLKTSPEAFLTTWMDRFEQAISDPDQIALMPGFLKFLNHLRQTDCLLGIASSTSKPRMQKTLQNGLLPRLEAPLDEVFGALLSGSDVTQTKPHPEIYMLAAERLGVSPETCCVFEDSQAGVQSGKAAGMTVFAVPNFFTAHQDHTEADHILSNLTEAIEKV